MATDKLFKVVGVSKHEGEYKVRFANDIMRIKVLDSKGHEDVRLCELDEPLSKYAAVQAIQHMSEYADAAAQSAITEYLEEKAPKQTTLKAGPAVVSATTETTTA